MADELHDIVTKMVENGESEKDIALVIQNYDRVKKKEKTQSFQESYTPVQEAVLPPGNGSGTIESSEPTFWDPIKQGYYQGKQAILASPGKKPEDYTEEDLLELAELNQKASTIPVSKEFQEFSESKDLKGVWEAFKKNPIGIITDLNTMSLTSMLTQSTGKTITEVKNLFTKGEVPDRLKNTFTTLDNAISDAVKNITGNEKVDNILNKIAKYYPPIAIPGKIIGAIDPPSLSLEYSGKIMETFQEAGININDKDSLKEAFEDEELFGKARELAMRKGIPIQMFDAVSAGVAGKIVGNVGKGITKKVGATLGELGVQAGMGGAGEASGQLAAGEPLHAGAIAGEVVGELGTGATEVFTGAKAQKTKQKEDAESIRKDTEPVPQEGTAVEEGKDDSGQDVQQIEEEQAESAEVKPEMQKDEEVVGELESKVEKIEPKKPKVPEEKPQKERDQRIVKDYDEKLEDRVKYYTPVSHKETMTEAKDIVDKYGEEESLGVISAKRTGISERLRNAVGYELLDRAIKNKNPEQELKVVEAVAEAGTEQGQALESRKIYNAMSPAAKVLAVEKATQKKRTEKVQKALPKISKLKQQLDAVDQELQSPTELQKRKASRKAKVEAAKAKLNSLKINIKGQANDISQVIGAELYNGAINVVEKAIEAGATVANAVDEAVTYIKDNFKGDWDEGNFRTFINDAIGDLDADIVNEATNRKREILEKTFKKAKKSEVDRIIEAHNSGVLDDATLREEWANIMGYPSLSEEQTTKLRELATKAYEAPEGDQKMVANDELANYIRNIQGINWADVGTALWYANLLSGPSTQALNINANFAEMVGELYTNIAYELGQGKGRRARANFLVKNLWGGLGKGLLAAHKVLTTGVSPYKGHIKFEYPGVLESAKFKGGGFNPANWAKYVFRFMTAADVLFYRGLKEMRSAQLAYRMAMEEGKSRPSKEISAKANEILGNTKERIVEAQKQAESEGLKGIDLKRRVWEILEQQRGQDLNDDANDFAARGTFNYQPEGTLGAIMKPIQKLNETTYVTRLVVPFTRVITNVANRYIDWTPIAFIRVAKGGIGWRNETKRIYTKEERAKVAIKAATGTLAMATLYALTQTKGEDEEPLIEITANGTGDYRKNYELQQGGWQPHSIRVGDKWISYKNTPLALPFAMIGYLNDSMKYKGEKAKDAFAKFGLMAYGTAKFWTDMTFLSSLSQFMGLIGEGGSESQIVSDIERYMRRTAKSFIVPNLVTQSSRTIQEIADLPIKKSFGFYEEVVRDLPVARDRLNNTYNALGEPVIPQAVKRFTPGASMAINRRRGSKAWDVILKHKAWVGTPRKTTTTYFPSERVERQLTPEEYTEFIKVSGEKIRKAIETKYDYLMKASPDKVKKALSKIKTNARRKALKEIALKR
jgi:hypothetical protein